MSDLAIIKTESDLTESQQVFLREYLRLWDARKAAVAAGYDANYGRTLVLQLDPIIRDRMGEDYMTDEELERRLIDIARGVPEKYLDEHGFVRFQELKDDNKTHLIKSVKRSKVGIEVNFYDAQRALELIGKSRGIVLGEVRRNLHQHVVDEEGSTRLDQKVDRIYGAREEDNSDVVDAEFSDVKDE
jgi:phage terminase small subunit